MDRRPTWGWRPDRARSSGAERLDQRGARLAEAGPLGQERAEVAVAVPPLARHGVRVPGPELGIGLGEEGPDAASEAALLRLDQMTQDVSTHHSPGAGCQRSRAPGSPVHSTRTARSEARSALATSRGPSGGVGSECVIGIGSSVRGVSAARRAARGGSRRARAIVANDPVNLAAGKSGTRRRVAPPRSPRARATGPRGTRRGRRVR